MNILEQMLVVGDCFDTTQALVYILKNYINI